MNKEVMKQVLEALKNNRRKHYGCEDTWYSCPKHEDGCYDEHAGSECNCGADEANVEIDAAIKILQKAQDEPDDLMAAYMSGLYDGKKQRTWVGLTDEEVMDAALQAGFDIHEDYENEDDPKMHGWDDDGDICDRPFLKIRDLIEVKLKEKNI